MGKRKHKKSAEAPALGDEAVPSSEEVEGVEAEIEGDAPPEGELPGGFDEPAGEDAPAEPNAHPKEASDQPKHVRPKDYKNS